MKQRILSLLLAAVLVCGWAVPSANALPIGDTSERDPAEASDFGTCGDALTWTLYGDGLLEITGTGAMRDYTCSNRSINTPWCGLSKSIKTVSIADGVTSIGNSAFIRCSSLTSVTLPDGVTRIENYAFRDCYSLTSATIPASVTYVGAEAFWECHTLTDVYYGGTERQRNEIRFDPSNDPLLNAAWHYDESSAPVYALTVTGGTGSGTYAEGETVTITANAPAADEAFAGWTGTEELSFDRAAATATFTMPAYAVTLTATYAQDDTPRLVVEHIKARPGETVTVNVSIRNNPGISSFRLGFACDPDLTLESVAKADGLTGSFHYKQTAVYVQDADLTEDCDLLTLTFAVSPEATAGEKSVEITYTEVSNETEEDVVLALVSGGVAVKTYIPGDINGDGVVNLKDLVRFIKYLSGEAVEVVEDALDVNGNGKVTIQDLVRLLKYLSGDDVEVF